MFWSVTWYWAFAAEIHDAAGVSSGASFDPAHRLADSASEARKTPVGTVPSGFAAWNGKSLAAPCTSSKLIPMKYL